jgi:hypothetical protein
MDVNDLKEWYCLLVTLYDLVGVHQYFAEFTASIFRVQEQAQLFSRTLQS